MSKVSRTTIDSRVRTVSRRQFLKRSTVAASIPLTGGFPWVHSNADTADIDVVIIGAGAAGLLATETLIKKGRSVLLLEASDRIGGRVHTNTSLFGVPYDRGAHWLHRAAGNPFVGYARNNGFSTYAAPSDDILYVGNRVATDDEAEAFESAYEAAVITIERAGANGKDVAPASVVPNSGEWTDTVHFNIGPFEMGKDFAHFSCLDWYNSEEGDDWFCKEGFGALLVHRSRNIPVQLNTPVSRVDWSGKGVEVTTPRGTVKAKKCIVTVSTGVLAHGHIQFHPALPAEKQASFDNISMGTYNHLALQFSENFFGVGNDGNLTYKIDSPGAPSPRGMGMLTNISGTNLSFGDVGGEFARELEKEGVAGGIDFALSELRKIFGHDVDKYFVKGDATRWAADPLFRGAYASAEPGAYKYRRQLRATVAERIYFAGEACSETEWATVHGAYKTGIKTANAVNHELS